MGYQKGLYNINIDILSESLKHAVSPYQLLENNPCNNVSAPVPEKPEIVAMNQNQVNKLLKAAKGKWVYDLIYVALFTGLRRGELLALRWQDIDFNTKKIQVKQGVTKVIVKELIFRKPKTDSSIRPVDIDDNIVSIFKKIKTRQNKYKLHYGSDYNNKYNLVFTHEESSPILPQLATRRYNKIAEKANLSNFRFHDLRHTHATMMLKAGIHPKVVQERLGHSSIKLTIDNYSHVLPSMQKEALKKLKNSLK